MSGDFAGETARWYARYRRDLPADQAGELAGRLGLSGGQVVVDLGCGTGQLGVPLRSHATAVVAVDPEAGMLVGLRARAVPGVLCVWATTPTYSRSDGWSGRWVRWWWATRCT